MEKTLKIDLKQREALVSLVNAARNEEEALLRDNTGVSRESVVMEIAKQKGCEAILKEIRRSFDQQEILKAKIRECDGKLLEMGFKRDDNELELHWNAPKSLKDAIESKLNT